MIVGNFPEPLTGPQAASILLGAEEIGQVANEAHIPPRPRCGTGAGTPAAFGPLPVRSFVAGLVLIMRDKLVRQGGGT